MNNATTDARSVFLSFTSLDREVARQVVQGLKTPASSMSGGTKTASAGAMTGRASSKGR